MNIKEFKHIHFVGIGGIGVSALARLSLNLGIKVSGSDIKESIITQALKDLGAAIYLDQKTENVADSVDLIIHTEDVNESSSGFSEVQAGIDRGLQVLKYSQALGLFIEGFYGVGISGTNGKSTTTAMLALIMEKAGTDPMVVLGSRLAKANESEKFKGNARIGSGKYFIYEADEYHRHMLDTKPKAAIITNIEADHLDYYKDINDIKAAFSEFVNNIPPDGVIVFNYDDNIATEVCLPPERKKITFAMQNGLANYTVKDIEAKNQTQEFNIFNQTKDLGRFTLRMPGNFNIMNALAATAMAIELGVSVEIIKDTLAHFSGIWRRFEFVGRKDKQIIISDYAHHPSGISGLIQATKQFYPNKKILFVFQPHQKNRTKMLFNEFVTALKEIDDLIIPEIYFVPGREKEEDQNISSKDLVEALAKAGKRAEYASDLEEAASLIQAKYSSHDVIICVGAGTIDQLARKLANKQ